MELNFGSRLNLLTGDNGLGKSFLLDVVWWAFARKWPAEVNPRLNSGKMALPSSDVDAKIAFSISTENINDENYESSFLRREQRWIGNDEHPINQSLILYAISDGSFAILDPYRNFRDTSNRVGERQQIPAFVLSQNEVWDGLQDENSIWLCNGLIRDWAGWQKERSTLFKNLRQVLEVLSPSRDEKIEPGKLTRIGLNDVRDIPTIRMPYQKDVAVVHASSGMRRIMALAYLLVWSWHEHKLAAKQIGESPATQLVFLIDEIESHLHPSWQRCIVPALLSVMKCIDKNVNIQLISSTHSPLIMASIEPLFDIKKDAWFDLDFINNNVNLKQQQFEKHGDVERWLMSDAFDLKSCRPLEYEHLVDEASKLLNEEQPNKEKILKMYEKLINALNPKDDFLFCWRAICEKKGFLK